MPRCRDIFPPVLEPVGKRDVLIVVGYVVMPEHIHLLLSAKATSEPSR